MSRCHTSHRFTASERRYTANLKKGINVKKLKVKLCLLQGLKICLNTPSPLKINFLLIILKNGPKKWGQIWITKMRHEHILRVCAWRCLCLLTLAILSYTPLPPPPQKRGQSWISTALDSVICLMLKTQEHESFYSSLCDHFITKINMLTWFFLHKLPKISVQPSKKHFEIP